MAAGKPPPCRRESVWAPLGLEQLHAGKKDTDLAVCSKGWAPKGGALRACGAPGVLLLA